MRQSGGNVTNPRQSNDLTQSRQKRNGSEKRTMRRSTAASYVDAYRKREEAHQNRVGLYNALSGLYDEGYRLHRGNYNARSIEDWEKRTSGLIERALVQGEYEANQFLIEDASYAQWGQDVDEDDSER